MSLEDNEGEGGTILAEEGNEALNVVAELKKGVRSWEEEGESNEEGLGQGGEVNVVEGDEVEEEAVELDHDELRGGDVGDHISVDELG